MVVSSANRNSDGKRDRWTSRMPIASCVRFSEGNVWFFLRSRRESQHYSASRLMDAGSVGHDKLPGVGRQTEGGSQAARPANPKLRGFFGQAEHLNRAILRPVSRTSMDFARCPQSGTELQTQRRANAARISLGPGQTNPQPRLGGTIVKQLRGRAVLRHDQVRPAI